jgi:transcriptional regulator with GAF, ATPase, and Fis domain
LNNKAQLFFDFTSAICKHLAPKDSLFAAFQVLKSHIPIDRTFLEAYDFDLGVVHVLAEATSDGGIELDRKVPIGAGLKNYIAARNASIDSPSVMIINEPASHPIARQMINAYGGTLDCSVMVLNPVLDEQVMGCMVVICESQQTYHQHDADIFALLDRPCAISISNTLKHRQVLYLQNLLAEENQQLQRELSTTANAAIIGADFGLAPTLSFAGKAAQHDSPVLLLGETGTGKDVIANHIHNVSIRNSGPFVRVNCGAIPESLMDSELFGHEKGAFTGAMGLKRGKFERAHGGTIFLDEIGELPLAAQVRLLRVLQNGEIERVGGTETIPIDIRVIAATHRNIEEMVELGTFREDVYFRLSVFPIKVPALRERKEDIPALLDYFVKRKSQLLKLGSPPRLTPKLVEEFCDYDWPGNVREMENVIERALIINEGDFLSVPTLSASISHKKPDALSATEPHQVTSLDTAIKAHIQQALDACNGQIHGKNGAAELLDINPNTLRSRMRKLNISFK